MKKKSYARIHQSKEYLSPLGEISCRSLFGGYSLMVENVIFAMVSKGELYLRACEETEVYFVKRAAQPLLYTKRGRTIKLNYYRVDEGLWNDRQQLLQLSMGTLFSARREKSRQKAQKRLKDLPNLTHNLEIMLWEAGIDNVRTLQAFGAKRTWIKLKSMKKGLGVQVLLALAGAIYGIHEAALPAAMRQELVEWGHLYEQRHRR
ncbi:TfoX/Sxy family DNA transformation protein [Buttiauxella warmboldiae]|uniref:TfoX/Sxy family DNA transformation protein n=1 Tax=Buttiauxella warmboldiae TaxID=82993 RepID=A0A3N5D2F4_9ENTR|nr:TfoX/Sxy family DNA transformation protein [Buttiauxella warmboldiae]RPH21712.1 TfoX/Sxy family DNA transformation protein [Buttiauxella warmboldiae]